MTDTPDIESIIAACEQDVAAIAEAAKHEASPLKPDIDWGTEEGCKRQWAAREAKARLARLGEPSVALAREFEDQHSRWHWEDCSEDCKYRAALLAWCRAAQEGGERGKVEA